MTAHYVSQAELSENFGEELCRRTLQAFGGQQIYIRARLSSHNPMVQTLGFEDAQKLADYFRAGNGGLLVEFPMGSNTTRDRLREMCIGFELTANTIARELGVHPRTVRRMRARLRAEAEAT